MVVVLRLCFMLLPFVNLLLALSPVKFKDYMIGSMIGLVPLVTIVVRTSPSDNALLGASSHNLMAHFLHMEFWNHCKCSCVSPL